METGTGVTTETVVIGPERPGHKQNPSSLNEEERKSSNTKQWEVARCTIRRARWKHSGGVELLWCLPACPPLSWKMMYGPQNVGAVALARRWRWRMSTVGRLAAVSGANVSDRCGCAPCLASLPFCEPRGNGVVISPKGTARRCRWLVAAFKQLQPAAR